VDSPYIPIRGSAWRLALGDTDGDGTRELIYGAYEGAVCCVRPSTGEVQWEAELGGFPFAVAAADLDGDGRCEILTAAADGTLTVFSGQGKRLWVFRSDRPLYSVCVGRFGADAEPGVVCGGMDRNVYLLSAQGKLLAKHEVQVVVHRLAVGDFDGDGRDEIYAIDNRETGEMLCFENNRLQRLWRRRIAVPARMRNWENPRASFFAFSLDTGDLDGDGKDDMVMGDTFFNRQAVMAMSGEGSTKWITEPLSWGGSEYEFYSTAFVRIAELPGSPPGPKVVSVAGGHVRLFGADGTLLGEAQARIGFSDLVVDGTTLYLASSPNGDNTIYRVDLSGDWQSQLTSLERHGLAREIGESLGDLRKQTLAYVGKAPQGRDAHRVLMFHVRPTPAACQQVAGQIQAFKEMLGYDNIEPVASMKVMESTPPLDERGEPWSPHRWAVDSIHGTMTVKQIVEAARLIEEHRVPTYFLIGHSCMPFITLDTAEKMLQTAPNYLLGFLSGEDEQIEKIPRYFTHFFGPLADLCRRYGERRCITVDKNVWWMSSPSRPETFDALFANDRGRVIVAGVEDSNSRTPEINLLARVGLRQAGLIDRFRVSIIGDLFSFCRFHQWEYPKHGHPYLRLLVAHTVLGGSEYNIRVRPVSGRGDQMRFTDLGRESSEVFLHMLGKGLVFTPRPEEMVGLSPVGLAVHAPPDKWLADGHNGHRPQLWRDDPELNAAVIPHNGCVWGNSPTPSHALQRVLLHKTRQFGCHVPATPYGPFAIVPAPADLNAVVGVEEWWHTDGVRVWRKGGPKLTGAEAGEALRESFEQGATRLPFRATGDDVFLQTLRLEDGRYRIYLIDPGWLDPRTRRVSLRVQLPGEYDLCDSLTGAAIPQSDRSAMVEVPAGSLRILDATRR
jgi:lambda-carrageenase